MNYLSVCSGIEAATQAWHPLGWSPVAFSEIEPFPSAVLAHHYPDVPNHGDMTKFKEWPDADVDVLVGVGAVEEQRIGTSLTFDHIVKTTIFLTNLGDFQTVKDRKSVV